MSERTHATQEARATQPPVVTGLLQRACSCGGSAGASGSCASCAAEDKLGVQPKLTIGPPGDAYEREADRVADAVVSGREAGPISSLGPGGLQREMGGEEEEEMQLQRESAEEEEEMQMQRQGMEEEEEVQAKPAGAQARPAAPQGFARRMGQESGGGRSLDAATRARFEPRFGMDLSHVRLHDGAGAQQLSHEIGARAFTHQSDIYFGAGQYSPETEQGQRLLAHEITHTFQQGGGDRSVVQRDLAIRPERAGATARALSDRDVRRAVDFNRRRFDDPYTLAVIRDVIGISRWPAVSDEELARAIGRWQAVNGVAEDGRIGPVTAMFLVEELQAEGQDTDALQIVSEFPSGTFLDVDTSFCGCQVDLAGKVEEANFFIAEYTACGADPSNTSGEDIEQCIDDRAAARGESLVEAGSTSASGQIQVAQTAGPCGALADRMTLAHEQIHGEDVSTLRQQHGSGRAFDRAFNDPQDWVADEVQARETDIAVANWMTRILDRICP